MRSVGAWLLYGLGYAAFVNCVCTILVGLRLLCISEAATFQADAIPFNADSPGYWAHVFLVVLMQGAWLVCSFVVPGVFVFLGARAVQRMRSRGRMIGGAIGSILLGLQGMSGVLRGILILLPDRSIAFSTGLEEALDQYLFLPYLFCGLLCLIQVLFCGWAGIRTLVSISQLDSGEHSEGEGKRSTRNRTKMR
jgi:hypothetical protein